MIPATNCSEKPTIHLRTFRFFRALGTASVSAQVARSGSSQEHREETMTRMLVALLVAGVLGTSWLALKKLMLHRRITTFHNEV